MKTITATRTYKIYIKDLKGRWILSNPKKEYIRFRNAFNAACKKYQFGRFQVIGKYFWE